MATLAEGEDRIGRASRNLSFLFLFSFFGISLGEVKDSRLYVCVYVCTFHLYCEKKKYCNIVECVDGKLLDIGDSEVVADWVGKNKNKKFICAGYPFHRAIP